MEMKRINNYEDYFISDDGRVWSTKTYRWLKPTVDKDGYKVVNLYKDNKRKCFRIHKLVGLHFIPIPYGATEIDHIDKNVANNNVDNLRWVSHIENCENRDYPKHTDWNGYYVYKDGVLLGVYDTLYKVEELYKCSRINLYKHMKKKTPTASGILVIPGIWLDK